MNKNSSTYTFIFAVVMVLVVAVSLAFTAEYLDPLQKTNVRQQQMQRILITAGLDSVKVDGQEKRLTRPLAEKFFKKYVQDQLALNYKGEVVDSVSAFKVNLAEQLLKPPKKQIYPMFVVKVKSEKFYVIPLRGHGLWDAIWGYMALEEDLNTIAGAVFDHAGETAGLGAEITKPYFENSFNGEKLFNKKGNFVGVVVKKGYSGANDKSDHAVKAISGATITSDGVTAMIKERYKHYIPYLRKLKAGADIAPVK